eukprot:m.54781 g.54781  ORF g.54781 m.54781 type:complete len:369 (-) comp7557_c0_seq1:1285-2391(-)
MYRLLHGRHSGKATCRQLRPSIKSTATKILQFVHIPLWGGCRPRDHQPQRLSMRLDKNGGIVNELAVNGKKSLVSSNFQFERSCFGILYKRFVDKIRRLVIRHHFGHGQTAGSPQNPQQITITIVQCDVSTRLVVAIEPLYQEAQKLDEITFHRLPRRRILGNAVDAEMRLQATAIVTGLCHRDIVVAVGAEVRQFARILFEPENASNGGHCKPCTAHPPPLVTPYINVRNKAPGNGQKRIQPGVALLHRQQIDTTRHALDDVEGRRHGAPRLDRMRHGVATPGGDDPNGYPTGSLRIGPGQETLHHFVHQAIATDNHNAVTEIGQRAVTHVIEGEIGSCCLYNMNVHVACVLDHGEGRALPDFERFA